MSARGWIGSGIALLLCGASVDLWAAEPGFASTAEVSSEDSGVVFTASDGESNDVRIRYGGATVRIEDRAQRVSPGPGCTALDPHTVVCVRDVQPRDDELSVSLGDMDDQLEIVTTKDAARPYRTTVTGGIGDDTITTSRGCDNLDGGEGDDVVSAGPQRPGRSFAFDSCEFLTGGPGNDHLSGGSGGETISPGTGDNIVYAGRGQDEVDMGLGHDDVHGGRGFDVIDYQEMTGDLAITMDDRPNDGLQTGDRDNIHTDNNWIWGGGGDDHLLGSNADDQFWGLGGDDVIDGGPGHDILEGDEGADRLRGGGGADTLLGGYDEDDLNGGLGNDRLYGGRDPDVLHSGIAAGSDVMDGQGSRTDLVLMTRDVDVKVSFDGLANDGVPGERDNVSENTEEIRTGAGDDVVVGSDYRRNTIWTGPGRDSVDVVRTWADRDVDTVDCGTDDDEVASDPEDVIDDSCETRQ